MAGLVLGTESERYVWLPVAVDVALDGGKKSQIKLEAKLLDPGQDRVAKIFEDQSPDEEVVAEVLDGWRKIVGITLPDGGEITYDNDEHRRSFLNFTGVEAAITAAWIDMVRGKKGRRKN